MRTFFEYSAVVSGWWIGYLGVRLLCYVIAEVLLTTGTEDGYAASLYRVLECGMSLIERFRTVFGSQFPPRANFEYLSSRT